MSTTAKEKTADNLRPLQILPWEEKTESWFKANADHYIAISRFKGGKSAAPGSGGKDFKTLYEVYNNQFPLDWFKHVTDPLSATKEAHKSFPAKIRPVTILRTNIDLLLGEYPRRPFVYNVENLGETGYNRFLEGMKQTAQQTLLQHFIQAALEEAKASGQELTPEQLAQLEQQPPVPEEVKAQFQSSYKDAIAIKGQKFLRRVIREHEVRRKMHRMFKHWLIAGEAYSYKDIQNESLVYKEISPMNLDYDKSESTIYIEDAEWVVHLDFRTLSDVVDQFYPDLSQKQHKDLEHKYWYASPGQFQSHLQGLYPESADQGKIPVYHVQWKGRKKVGFLSYLDLETFQIVEDIVDENYVIDREKGEQVEWRWVNEVYEAWRIGADIYTGLRACPVQRNEMNNISTCKLAYNGRKYSDTHSASLSVLEMGIPFQIMYIIITYTLEKTIAKSKGKILLIDQNAIPDEDEWDEEKFFYYSEALGYGLLNRNQVGVDKTWNQYQVVDMSLFDQIQQLIELQNHFKQQWDDIIGISRQRKGQTYASDGQGVNERSVFQSTVITDMIFLGFEEFCERELQGLMDLGKFLTAKGVYGTYNDDEYGIQLMEIMPEDFMHEELGIFVESSSEQMRKLQEMKGYAQAMVQNGHKASTVLDVIDSINVAELRQKLKQIEAIDAEIEQANAASEQEREQILEEMRKAYREYDSLLKRDEMHEEYDRKEDLEMIKGAFTTYTFQDGDSNDNGVPDTAEVMKLTQNQQKIVLDFENKKADREEKQKDRDLKKQALEQKAAQDKERNKIDKQKVKVAARKKSTAK